MFKIVQSPNINYLWASLMIEELIRNGVDYFCISPGSRSAPLTMAAAFHKKAKTCVHFDERGMGFHALGYVSATKKPCVIITTSGTAVANLFPAIIEASKKKLPLIILTADRPPELRFTGAHQTIDQVKIFGNYVKWQFDMPCPTTEISPEFILTTTDQAVYQSKSNLSSPVHINCMFREPLDLRKDKTNITQYLKTVSLWIKKTALYTEYHAPIKTLTSNTLQLITQKLKNIKRGMIVVGKLSSQEEQNYVLKLAEKLNWAVFPDISSGLRLGSAHEHLITYFDQILLHEKINKQHFPDGILHLGGRITSKRWYQFVEKCNPKEYIMVLNHALRNDPLHNVSIHVECSVHHFCQKMIPKIAHTKQTLFLSIWQKVNTQISKKISAVLDKDDLLTESAIARLITQYIPEKTGLFLSNSMSIREIDMYGHPGNFFSNSFLGKKLIEVGANRGASGIDGIIASASGFAQGLNKMTTLLIGDLAFLHDLNSLAILRQLKESLVIIVMNNHGGKIFSHLPIAENNPYFTDYFQTPHPLSFHAAAEMFDLNYAHVESKKEFIKTYTIAVKSNTSTIIEIPTKGDLT